MMPNFLSNFRFKEEMIDGFCTVVNAAFTPHRAKDSFLHNSGIHSNCIVPNFPKETTRSCRVKLTLLKIYFLSRGELVLVDQLFEIGNRVFATIAKNDQVISKHHKTCCARMKSIGDKGSPCLRPLVDLNRVFINVERRCTEKLTKEISGHIPNDLSMIEFGVFVPILHPITSGFLFQKGVVPKDPDVAIDVTPIQRVLKMGFIIFLESLKFIVLGDSLKNLKFVFAIMLLLLWFCHVLIVITCVLGLYNLG
ncbi:hypothetical protein CASFOL_000587 [Castilleja foliolosa]|uniref:Uncharacterized protein n=1 Tax=Castilleja foliolosa TaxID=1961234 RepID=A0ABD3EKM5_9LAMI